MDPSRDILTRLVESEEAKSKIEEEELLANSPIKESAVPNVTNHCYYQF